MEPINPGMKVRIQCKVKSRPFPGERLVMFDTLDGPISGFVKENELVADRWKWFIIGIVQSVERDYLAVNLSGSFFTTNGIAHLSREMAMAA